MHSHIGCIFLIFLRCVFSNVSSNGLPEKKQSHIACICLTLPHCALSNVSLNRLPVKIQSHIGCICLTFLHSAFSNVPSNGLPETMHNHTGYICLTFLHCAFSNVSSRHLHIALGDNQFFKNIVQFEFKGVSFQRPAVVWRSSLLLPFCCQWWIKIWKRTVEKSQTNATTALLGGQTDKWHVNIWFLDSMWASGQAWLS